MSDKRQNIVSRFFIMYLILCLGFVAVIYKIAVLQFVERDNWLALASKQKKTDIIVKPNRGNIFASDGRLMASSIPTYYVYMDMRVEALHIKDGKLFKENVDSLSISLSRFFGDKSAHEYRRILENGWRNKNPELRITSRRVSYSELKEMRKMPLYRLGRNKSGLITKEMLRRVKPFGSLASRTIGDIFGEEEKGGRNGLELHFNDELVGKPGVSVRQKVANRFEEKILVEPIDGLDVLTTIDIDIQDIAEKTLVDSLRMFNAHSGYVVVMEVKTGEVKAIVNMERNADGSYSEKRNGAVQDMSEPGSTFKVASIMAALDDGKIKLGDTIDTGNGIHYYNPKAPMRDHNHERGGYGKLTVEEIIHASSNVGISKIIVNAYGNNTEAFVNKLYAMKLNQPLNLEIPGTAIPNIRHPKDKNSNWSGTTLPWMSIGYETQIPPIYTLTFFNAIANNGKMIRPVFTKALMRNGQVIKTFKTETITESICKKTTLNDIRTILPGVIEGEKGTAKNMVSDVVRIAGKTGTAQISKGALGYRSGGKTHQVSFCGYFPADNPEYSAIVVIREPRSRPPSGGRMAGGVFKDIAERIVSLKSQRTPLMVAQDTTVNFPLLPNAKNGNYKALNKVTRELNLPFSGEKCEWVKSSIDKTHISTQPIEVKENTVPNLMGMGAKDAVYLLNEMGLRVQLHGRGKVVSQNLLPGVKPQKGQTIVLRLN